MGDFDQNDVHRGSMIPFTAGDFEDAKKKTVIRKGTKPALL
jgi:hypothetical protein